MSRIVIRGRAAVFRDEEQVTDPVVLKSLDGLVYDDERFTDYLGGSPEEDAVAAVLEPGGLLRFSHEGTIPFLSATTEYQSNRPLTEPELRALVAYAMGQWSDGIGENWTCESSDRCGFTIMCLSTAGGSPDYPSVNIIDGQPAMMPLQLSRA